MIIFMSSSSRPLGGADEDHWPEELIEDPEWATPEVRLPKLDTCFAMIEEWTNQDKFEAMETERFNVPCGLILSMQELAEDESLRATGTVVEVPHPQRGTYLTVGNPIKLPHRRRGAALAAGEHTDEILTAVLGMSSDDVAAARAEGAV